MKKTLLFLSLFVTSISSQAQINNGLVAKYYFNSGNANDEVGTNNGTVNGATLTTDRFGNPNKAYSFDGTNDFIDFGDAPMFNFGTGDFSISMWVNYSVAQQSNIISKRAGAAADYDMYGISINADPYFGGASQNVNTLLRSSNSEDRVLEAGNQANGWHHIVVVNSYTSKSYCYIDGVPADSSNTVYTGNFNVSGFPLVVGYQSESNSNFYNGSVDDIRIYNRALSLAEAVLLFNEAAPVFPLTEDLIAKYTFNSGTAVDESGNNHNGTINGATLTTDRFGNPNKAFQFAQNQTITVADNNALDGMTDAFSISFWLNAPPIISNSNNLISKFSFCGGGFDAYNIRINTNGKIWMQLDDESGFDSYQTGSITVADNNWHHITITWNKPNVMIYVDGVADVSGSYTLFNSVVSNSPDVLAFGQVISDFCGASYEYNEKMDDIRIYGRTLGQVEIDSLYNEAAPVFPLTEDLIAKYTFNSGSAVDESGNDNHGTVNGATLTTDRFGNTGHAYRFDGVDDKIDFSGSTDFELGQTSFTISMWAKFSTAQFAPILGKRNDNPTFDQYTIYAGELGSPSTKVGMYFKPSPGGIGAVERSFWSAPVNSSWHNIVVVHRFSDSTSLYIDGQLIGSDYDAFSTENFNIVGANLIAGYANVLGTDYYFNGDLDDIRIYGRPLGQVEIDSLFEDPNPSTNAIFENSSTQKINIYPNPAQTTLNIYAPIPTQVIIMNSLGQEITKIPVNYTQTIDVSNFASGVYFIKDLNSSAIYKFIKD